MKSSLVSVIMPAYNSEKYIGQAINSIINQSYDNWELIIINDGSKDRTKEIVLSFSDPRIKYLEQLNEGVSKARNLGLDVMKGDFFCFLDADDIFTRESIEVRVKALTKLSQIDVIDCLVDIRTNDLYSKIAEYRPNYQGLWWKELIKLSSKCFFGINTFFRNKKDVIWRFPVKVTHGEDLIFCLKYAYSENLIYGWVDETCYIVRKSNDSAMSNLRGLENGYKEIYKVINSFSEVGIFDKIRLVFKIRRITFLSYLSKKDYKSALRQISI